MFAGYRWGSPAVVTIVVCSEGVYLLKPTSSLFDCYYLYLYEGTLGQLLNGNGRAGRVGLTEKFGIHLVHGGKVVHVGEEYRCFYDMAQVSAGCLQNALYVGKALTGLLLDASLGETASGGIYGQLSRCIDETVNFDGLAIRSDSCRCIVCVDCVHSLLCLYLNIA